MKRLFLLSVLVMGALMMSAQIEEYVPSQTNTEQSVQPALSYLPLYNGEFIDKDDFNNIYNLVGQKLYFSGLTQSGFGVRMNKDNLPLALAIQIDDVNHSWKFVEFNKGYYSVVEQIFTKEDGQKFREKLLSYTGLKNEISSYNCFSICFYQKFIILLHSI